MPAVAGPQFDALEPEAFLVPAHRRCGGDRRCRVAARGRSGPDWMAAVAVHLPDERLRSGVNALAVEPLRSGPMAQERYAEPSWRACTRSSSGGRSRALKSELQRINPQDQPDEHARLFGELIALESHRRGLRERAIGGQ